jgi:hypothetical protein
MKTDAKTLVQQHLAAWNAPAGHERAASIASIYSPDVVIGEPEALLVGHDAMTGAIDRLQSMMPGMALASQGPVQTSQDMTTYGWTLGPPDGDPIAYGRDVITVRDGLISSVYVFIDA